MSMCWVYYKKKWGENLFSRECLVGTIGILGSEMLFLFLFLFLLGCVDFFLSFSLYLVSLCGVFVS